MGVARYVGARLHWGRFFPHILLGHAAFFSHLRYTLGYRGHDLEVSRDLSIWHVGIYPKKADLPILRRCEVYSQNPNDAVGEAKRRVDAAL
jgi:hypothetical protein